MIESGEDDVDDVLDVVRRRTERGGDVDGTADVISRGR